ncbi:MAG: hypothetical protein ACYC1I_02860 [Acidimicrobiales bacterium]
MSRRIEIEITSLNGDVATWRAAGAKLPKGVLSTSLVPGGPVIGGIYRADIEQFMEGIEVLAVLPPKTASPLDPRHERVELLPKAAQGPDVIVTYAPKGRGGARREGGRDGGRDGEGRRDASKRPAGRPQSKDRSPGAPSGARPERGPRSETGSRPERGPRSEAGSRPERGPRSDRSSGGARSARPGRGERPSGPAAPPMTTTYRNALLATLSPEQLPVAEQLLRGGMPAVRTAVAEQNKNATAQGRPTIDPATIERIAEDLLAKTTLALWKDKAAGAIGAGRELRLRDLRAVVTAAKTVSLDDEGRSQLKELQSNLSARLEVLRTQWNERLEAAVASKNVPEALRLVARPPDMSTRVSAEMATKVVTITSEALTSDLDVAKWQEIVNLTVDTSIRRNVKPVGIPNDDACKALAVKNAGAIPEFAKLLGMKVPPPPPPTRTPRRPTTRRAS